MTKRTTDAEKFMNGPIRKAYDLRRNLLASCHTVIEWGVWPNSFLAVEAKGRINSDILKMVESHDYEFLYCHIINKDEDGYTDDYCMRMVFKVRGE